MNRKVTWKMKGKIRTSALDFSRENGELEVISESVPALGTATCWVQISDNNRFAFMANTASNDITTFGIGHDGSLERLHLTPTGKGPLGMAMSVDDRFLYNLNGKSGTITAFRNRQERWPPHAVPEDRCWVESCFRNDGSLVHAGT